MAVAALYRAGAIFVLPSSVEGMPNALLEAMGHGLPCIVSDSIAVAHDYIEDGVAGLLFAADSAADLARRIESLAAPERRAAMGAAARQKLLATAPDEAYHAWDRAILPDAKNQ
jgi:glycosyltransferase involved in cell wall biosynthesis